MDSLESELSSLTNEDYLSARAKRILASGNDPLGARAWLTTAKMMFPNNFEIQFEAYVLEKNENEPNIKKAAKLLANLFENFGTEAKKVKNENSYNSLWQEIDNMTTLLRTPGQEKAFLCCVFDNMPKLCRQKVLIESALRSSEHDGGYSERIRILMLAFHKFPDLIEAHGGECLEYTIEECKHTSSALLDEDSPLSKHESKANLNPEEYSIHHLLVHKICPLLLTQNELILDPGVLFDLLSLIIQFVLVKIAEAQGLLTKESNLNQNKFAANMSGIPWALIIRSLEDIGRRLDWHITKNLAQNSTTSHDPIPSDQLWQKIVAFHQQTCSQRNSGGHVSADPLDQIFYTATIFFLKHLSEFIWISTNSIFSKKTVITRRFKKYIQSNCNEEAILIEGFVDHVDDHSRNSMQHPLKRRRTTEEERKYPLVTDGRAIFEQTNNHNEESDTSSKTDLVRSFKMAIKYYELLRSDADLNNNLQKMLQKSNIGNKNVSVINHHTTLASFYADYQLYQGQFREALQYLRQIPSYTNSSDSNISEESNYASARMCRLHLRMASVHFCMGEYQFVADQIIQAVCSLQKNYQNEDEDTFSEEFVHIPESISEQESNEKRLGRTLKQATVRSRHVHFLPFTRQSILSYCCRLLIHILKDRCLNDIGNTKNDFAIGHVIVLLQYCYPEEKDLLNMLLHRIKLKDTFTYPIFCNYVIHIQFLEEFAYIVNAGCSNNGAAPMGTALGGTGVVLDICNPDLNKSSESVGSSRRLGTRGANKGEKTEVRAALKKQVARSYESLDVLIADFLTKNRDSIFQCLL